MVNYDFSQSFILASAGRAVLPGADLTNPVTQALGSTGSGSVTSSLWQGTAGQRTSDSRMCGGSMKVEVRKGHVPGYQAQTGPTTCLYFYMNITRCGEAGEMPWL